MSDLSRDRLVEAEIRCAAALIEGREPTVEEERPLMEFVRGLDDRPEVRLLLVRRFRERREERVGQLLGTVRAAAAGSGSTNGVSGRGLGVASLVEELGAAWAPRKGERNGLPAE